MDTQGPIVESLRQYMESATITQALIIIAGLVIVVLFIVFVFNRLFGALQNQIDNQQRQINQQQRQLDISEKNADTAAKNAESFRRSTNSLEEMTDQMRNSNTAIAQATKGIGDLGAAQAGTNDLITAKSREAVQAIVEELLRVEKSFESFFDASKTPDSPIYMAMRESLKPEFDTLARGLHDLKLLIPTIPVPQPPPPPPEPEPTTPPLPALPPATEKTLVRETWQGTTLYDENSPDPARRWIQANSPSAANAATRIMPYGNGAVLEMELKPSAYGSPAAARVFYTNGGRWNTLEGLDTLYVRYWVQINAALNIDEGDGTKGLYATLGFQLKDAGVTANALIQLNARTFNGTTYALLRLADGTPIQSEPFAYEAGKWTQVDLVIPLRRDATAKIKALFNGLLRLTGIGRSLDAGGSGTGWGLTFQSNALRTSPARVLFGGLIASAEPILDTRLPETVTEPETTV